MLSISSVRRHNAMGIWLALLVVTVVIVLLVARPADCVIRSREGDVTIKGKLTNSQRLVVEEFLQKHFPEGNLRIALNYAKAERRLKVEIKGAPSEGEKQMIRNFFHSEF